MTAVETPHAGSRNLEAFVRRHGASFHVRATVVGGNAGQSELGTDVGDDAARHEERIAPSRRD
jgi:hypothetical protein